MGQSFTKQKNEMAVMLVYQTNPVGIQLFSYVNNFFCSHKFAWQLDTWENTLYSSDWLFNTCGKYDNYDISSIEPDLPQEEGLQTYAWLGRESFHAATQTTCFLSDWA